VTTLRREVRALAARAGRTWSLLKILTPRQFKVRYRESVLDLAWAIITPLVFLAVYGIILTQAFQATSECAPYLISAWIGLVIWTFFAGGLGAASTSLINASDLIGKVYFPREAVPLSDVGLSLIDLGIGVVTIGLLAIIQQVNILHPTTIAIVPALLVVIVWTAALSVLCGALAVFLRDVAHGVQVFLRAGFFATPVMYEASFLPRSLEWTAAVNPVAVSIEALRDCLLCGEWPRWGVLGAQLAAGSVLLMVAILYVRRVEHRMADVL
jgi:lipopolysaccharide transport system permease protein